MRSRCLGWSVGAAAPLLGDHLAASSTQAEGAPANVAGILYFIVSVPLTADASAIVGTSQLVLFWVASNGNLKTLQNNTRIVRVEILSSAHERCYKRLCKSHTFQKTKLSTAHCSLRYFSWVVF